MLRTSLSTIGTSWGSGVGGCSSSGSSADDYSSSGSGAGGWDFFFFFVFIFFFDGLAVGEGCDDLGFGDSVIGDGASVSNIGEVSCMIAGVDARIVSTVGGGLSFNDDSCGSVSWIHPWISWMDPWIWTIVSW